MGGPATHGKNAAMKLLARLLEKLELWARHRAARMPYTVYCYYCNAKITAPSDEIFEAIRSHNNHPAHKAAKDRSQ